jgi:hypothetical protein
MTTDLYRVGVEDALTTLGNRRRKVHCIVNCIVDKSGVIRVLHTFYCHRGQGDSLFHYC